MGKSGIYRAHESGQPLIDIILDRAMAKYYYTPRPPEIVLKEEQGLYMAIIGQAIKDLFKKVRTNTRPETVTEIENDRESAVMFLFSKQKRWREHREMIFYSAGLDPDVPLSDLRRRYLEMS